MGSFRKVMLGMVAGSVALLVGCSNSVEPVDLDRVLDVTASTIDRLSTDTSITDENVMLQKLASELQNDLNAANPAIHQQQLGVNLHEDGSLHGYNDEDQNGEKNGSEQGLFKIEVDAENNRLIASNEGYVRDHRFSGAGLLAGMLIGSMLSRQRAAGVNSKALASKQTSSYQNARTRSGSGSHSKGK